MSFKFSVLNLEKEDDCNCNDNSTKKLTGHKQKFADAVRKCHKNTKTPKSFGKCMKKELQK